MKLFTIAGIALGLFALGCSEAQLAENQGGGQHQEPRQVAEASIATDGNVATDAAPVSESEDKKVESQKELLFFINPHGRPCQMQDEILTKMGTKLTDKADLRYIKTTVQSDRQEFYKYGIRALPSMVLLDSEGNVAKRFPPGIQNEESILKSL